jgi:hypothetical protein
MRFTSDYDEIENGINFFQINTTYVEAENYLDTYLMLKRIALTRYYNYMSNSLQVFFNLMDGIAVKDEFFNSILDHIPKNMNKKIYNVPKNFEKIKIVQQFFETKSKYDYEVKRTIEDIKKKFVEQRSAMLKPFYEEILNEIGKSFSKTPLNEAEKNKVNFSFGEISKFLICEILFFSILFQSSIQDNIYILQKITYDLYENLYNHLRPIIVASDSIHLEELLLLFDSLSENFVLFFIELTDKDGQAYNIEEVNQKILMFFRSFYITVNQKEINSEIDIKSRSNTPISEDLIKKKIEPIYEIIKISKILIRPTILKLVQDIQEKIYFAVHFLIKNNLIEFDEGSNLSFHEEKVAINYPHFRLFHYFLRKMAILFDLLRNKLDSKVLNELAAFAIEKFIANLNEEILNKKNLTYDFEIYIIQQILLGIKITEEFEVEAVESGVEIDFYSITEIFKNNFSNLFSNFSFKDMIFNSAMNVYDKTRDYKKILYNNLLKSYKILINLVNEFIFGRDLMDLVYKMRKKESLDDSIFQERIKQRKENLLLTEENFKKIIQELNNQIKIIDPKIAEKLSLTILENINNILNLFRIVVANSQELSDLKICENLNIN